MIPFSHPESWTRLTSSCYELGHTWCPSCSRSAIGVFISCIIEAARIYTPLYLISHVLQRQRLKRLVTSTFPNILRSSLFLGINGGGFITFICLLRKLTGSFYLYSSAYVPAFLASLLAILSERKNRRGLLMTYVCSIALETLYKMLHFRSYVPVVPYGEVALFSVSSSALLWAHRSTGLQDAIGSILNLLFTPRIPGSSYLLKGLSLHHPKYRSWRLAMTQVMMVSLWSFTIGYMIQTLISLWSSWSKLLKHPRRIKKSLVNKYNLQFGLFLASFAGGFKAVNAVLHVLPVSRNVRILVAGAVAGLSMGCVRSVTIALYALTKAIDVIYMNAAKRGLVPRWYYGDALLYSVATALIFHAMFFEAHNIRPAYVKFLDRLTWSKIREINYKDLDVFGTQASRWTSGF